MKLSATWHMSAFFVLLASPFALTQDWVGSTGTPANPSQVTLSGAAAYVHSSISNGTAVLHYNVLPVGDLTTSIVTPGQLTGCRQLFVRYLDNGADARVTVDLMQLNVSTGATTNLTSFDSDTKPTTSNTSFKEASSSCDTFDFTFADQPLGASESVYYFEVKLQKTASDGVAAIRELHLKTFIF